ncbi:MAG TPA: transposase [Gaiellaceae bacterium]|nr:transposase [Gaiellaceae bacterium]
MYHVISRGNRQEPIFLEDRDRRRFLGMLESVVLRFEWQCLTYCLMDNHFHLLVETPKPNLSRGMQRLKGTYGRYFNDRYGLVGHLFQGRFSSPLVTGEEYQLEVARYIVRNPVRAGIVGAPDDYVWSSYRATVGLAPAPSFLAVSRLLETYGGGWVGRARFKAFVDDAAGDEPSAGDMSLGLTPVVAAAAK